MKLIIATVVTWFYLMSCSGCNSSGPGADTDPVPDLDTDTAQCMTGYQYRCESNKAYNCVAGSWQVTDCSADNLICETTRAAAECVALSDPDTVPDTDGYDPDCPPYDKAGFPYYDKEGTINFCRKCDTPTPADPQCAANIWKEANEKLFAAYPDSDCAPYPCVMENLEPVYQGERQGYYLDKCDMMLNPKNPAGWSSGMPTFKHFNFSDGKIGMALERVSIAEYPANFRSFEFDVTARKYMIKRMASGNDTLTYRKGAMFNAVADPRPENLNEYFVYSDAAGNVRVAYNAPVRSVAYTPAMNDTWVFVNTQKAGTSGYQMEYARIGEWKWTSLGQNIAYHPNIVNNKLALYTDDFKGYLCDLSTYPDSLSKCTLLNQGEEEIRYPKIDQQHPNIIYYENVAKASEHILIKLDVSAAPFTYTEIKIPGMHENTFSVGINQVKDNIILITNTFIVPGQEGDGRICYYLINKNSTYCSLPTDHGEYGMLYRQAWAEFEGHWLTWQDSVQPLMKLRDMECYCDWHPELCPFDDYTPQPDHPKDVKTGKRE